MTTTIAFSTTADGFVSSANSNYTTMRNGSGLAADTSGEITWGQQVVLGTYTGYQAFLDFAYTIPAGERVTAAYIQTKAIAATNTATSRTLTWVEYDWGGSLTTADWRTAAQISAIVDQLGNIDTAEDAGTKYFMAGGDALVLRLNSGASPLYLMGASDLLRTGSTPANQQTATFEGADASGTAFDPALIFTSVPESRLFGVLGAQVQLSDGTHAFLESQGEAAGSNVLLKHHDGSSASTIATITADAVFALSNAPGAQYFALVVDDVDHLYVIAQSNVSGATLAAQGFAKGVGYTWTAKTALHAALPSYPEGSINNVAAAFHSGSNSIMVVASHVAGRTPQAVGDIVFAMLNVDNLILGSGSLLRMSESGRETISNPSVDANYYTSFANETGTVLDVVAAPGTTNRGYVVTAAPLATLDDAVSPSVVRYIVAADGVGLSNRADGSSSTTQFVTKDASAKLRVIGINGTTFAVISADETSGWGLTVHVLQNTGTSSTFQILGTIKLDAESLTSMPDEDTLAVSQAWDAIYDSAANKVFVYYFDTADAHRLMRTGVDINTHLADGDETEVNDSVGASGSTNHAIRVHRGETQGQQVLISVANETSGGTHSTVYVTDTINLPPNQPPLAPRANFDAHTSALFSWGFGDPNIGDTQSAFQLQINNASTGASAFDTGKTTETDSNYTLAASAIANGVSYWWRVRVWDSGDEVSSYSAIGNFSTAAGGNVTITDPATDNPAGVITDNYTVQWSVSGTTQASYRVVVTKTSDDSTHINTGYVSSVNTTFAVTGMATDEEYEVAVTVKNASNVESGTGTRLITPDYNNVPTPMFTLTENDSGTYITVDVTNPAPSGDNPAATSNDILRRRADSDGPYTVIANIDADGSYDDYAVASNVSYEYIVRAKS